MTDQTPAPTSATPDPQLADVHARVIVAARTLATLGARDDVPADARATHERAGLAALLELGRVITDGRGPAVPSPVESSLAPVRAALVALESRLEQMASTAPERFPGLRANLGQGAQLARGALHELRRLAAAAEGA